MKLFKVEWSEIYNLEATFEAETEEAAKEMASFLTDGKLQEVVEATDGDNACFLEAISPMEVELLSTNMDNTEV